MRKTLLFATLLSLCSISVVCAWESEDIWVNNCESARPYQKWTYEPSTMLIRFAVGIDPDQNCLDASWSGSPGKIIHTWGCDKNNFNQAFILRPVGEYLNIAFKNQSNYCVNAYDTEFGSPVVLGDCNLDTAKWKYDNATRHFTLARSDLCLDAGVFNSSCRDGTNKGHLYCNPSASFAQRAADLVSRLTLTEIAANLQNENFGVKRLGIPPFRFNEALHGVASACGEIVNGNTGCPTSFPHALLLSSTFNSTLWHKIGQTISTEARALNNQGIVGWAFWTPDINLFRDPRWGRGQEVPGEDPFLSGEYAMQFISGLQNGSDTKYTKIVSTAKHFVDYDLEGTSGDLNRGSFNASVNLQDQVAFFFPSFKAAVIGGQVKSIMCSYNAVNGMPSCANNWFQNKIVRDMWGFDGFIVSDCGAINDGAFNRYITEHFYGSSDWQAQQGISGGTDVECGNFYQGSIPHSVLSGVLNRTTLNEAAYRFYYQYIALGLLDTDVSYTKLGPENVDSPNARQLALEAAQQGIVLLKNDKGLLPLSKTKNYALIGPHFNSTRYMLSIYEGDNTLVNSHSPYLAFRNNKIPIAGYALGCDLASNDTSGIAEAVAVAKKADVAILFVGLQPGSGSAPQREDEGHDRSSLDLPGVQLQLIQEIVATGKPVVVVLIHGGPIAIEWVQEHVPAIVDAKYPGELGGDAILSILFGDVSPAGRLTSTVYPSDFVNKRTIWDMGLQEKGGITYQYYTGKPLWEFGFGMSYTTFTYKIKNFELKATTSVLANSYKQYYLSKGADYGGPVFEVTVANTGKVKSDVVVLGFISSGVAGQPKRELFGYQRTHLAPFNNATLQFRVPPPVISQVDSSGTETIKPGNYSIFFGDNFSNATAVLIVTGSAISVFSLPPKPAIPKVEFFSPAQYLGCFKDSESDRDLSVKILDSGATISSCRTACGVHRFYYSGLQNGGECWCGNSYGALGNTSAECKTPCTADKAEICGGTYANSIYLVGQMGYLGCFGDGTPRDLPVQLPSSNSQTVEKCRGDCLKAGYTYSGVQFASQCFCGNSFGNHGKGTESDCNMPCTGDSTEMCGSAGRNSVYVSKLLP